MILQKPGAWRTWLGAILALGLPTASLARPAPVETTAPVCPGVPAVSSSAEDQIRTALGRIQAGAKGWREYNSLAIGLTRRARETGDPGYYDRALGALDEAIRLDPENADALRVSAWVRMGRHEFALARRIIRRFLARHPADATGWGVLGDASMELGLYDEAEDAIQRMNDLRPGPAAYSRAAYARELRGDVDGALELMRMSLLATAPGDAEDRAWYLVQIGHLQQLRGDPGGAEESYRTALASFPGYHYALAALAETVLRSGRPEQAETLARVAIKAAPHAERYLVLADALRRLGREAEAGTAEDRFERLALADSRRADNENHDLVLFYLERRPDPARALAIARREARIRRDVHTLDRLAWALYRNGRVRAAARLARQIVMTGTPDPLIARHAEEIRGSVVQDVPSPARSRPCLR